MRITDSILYRTVKRSMQQTSQRVMDQQEKISSGKRINRPSDDPLGAMRAQQLYNNISRIDQFQRNNMFAKLWINETESALDQAKDIIVRLKELAVSLSSESYDDEARAIAAKEVRVLRDHVLNIANSRAGTRSIFAGHETGTSAFLPNGTYNGDNGEIHVNIDNDVTVKLNLIGSDVFQSGPGRNIFDTLDDFVTALEANDSQTVKTQILDELDTNFLALRQNIAEVGARINSLDLSENSNQLLKIGKTEQLGIVEEVDIFETVTDMESARNAFQGALLNARDIGKLSLANFL